MKFFLDTANLDEIREGVSLGLVDGVTTNPSLMSKETTDFKKQIREICKIVDGPVNAEVFSTEAEGMIREARELVKIHENVVVKIPMIPEGLKAIQTLADEGIPTNTTLIFSPVQALLAAKAGASYVSPFVGRLDDISSVGMEVVEQIVTIFDNYGYEAEIIVASVRHPGHVLEAALIGADIATVPLKVIKQLAVHPLTDIGLKQFLDDWNKVNKK
jgi:transaldolase